MNSSTGNSPTEQSELSTLEGKVAFLRELPFFSNTPLETVRLYAYLCEKEEYMAGDTIVCEGEPANRMFLILNGKVSICQRHREREFLLQVLEAGGLNYFGELVLLAEFEWFFSARAITNVTVLSLTRKSFRKIMEKFPERFSETVAKIVSLRIRRFIDQTDYLLENLKEEAWRKCTAPPPRK